MNKVLCMYEELCVVIKKLVIGKEIYEVINSSGFSYFKSKKRMLKVLKNKKGYKIEINVEFSKEVEKKYGLVKLSIKEKMDKKLGSMWYYYESLEMGKMEEIIKEIIKVFLDEKEVINEEKEVVINEEKEVVIKEKKKEVKEEKKVVIKKEEKKVVWKIIKKGGDLNFNNIDNFNNYFR